MPKGKNRHLTIQDRLAIEQGLANKQSLASIARSISVSTSTVSREIKQNRHLHIPKGRSFNVCIHKRDCARIAICGPGCSIGRCKSCYRVRCNEVCSEFEEHFCKTLDAAPFLCLDCYRRRNCGFRHADYYAVYAQQLYEKRLVETREGISLSPGELRATINAVRALLLKGHSFDAICASNNPAIKVSARTLYRYAEAGIFGIANIDLPRKVRYKPRKKRAIIDRPVDRDGRSYSDFLDLPEELRERAVQMDTVMGKRGDFKCILTLHFPKTEFQIHLLLDEHTCECVVGALDWIETLCEGSFREYFPILLTDRGIEFGDFNAIERSCLRPGKRCKVFYCDPMASHQKASCEKNHVELRRIIPKGTSIEHLTPYVMAEVSSNVNNYPRKSLGGETPYALAAKTLPKGLLDGLGLRRIAPGDVVMKPSLIK